jgi:phosphoribosylanthranilate isomerase
MKIKVCGMKYPENIIELCDLPIHMMGLIFYEKSLRYAGELNVEHLSKVRSCMQLVGVFVNEIQENILKKIQKYDLQIVQLHGMESPVTCKDLKSKGIKVIKTFQIEEPGDLKKCIFYENVCDYFLFDTKTSQYGGSGKKFDWQILLSYESQTPFFLSGGIGMDDIESIKQLNIPQLYAIDVNSRFEIAPGLKDISKLKQFISYLSPAPY